MGVKSTHLLTPNQRWQRKRRPSPFEEGVSSMWRKPLFESRKRPLQIKRIPQSRDRCPRLSAQVGYFDRKNMSLGQYVLMSFCLKTTMRAGQTRASVPTCGTIFVCKKHYFPPSPFGEGTGVRLLLPLGEAGWGFQTRASVLTLSILFDY